MKKKLFIALLSLVCTLTCTGFVACSNGGDSKTDNPTDSHTHSWSAVWESDQTHHWHECAANDCTITDNTQKDSYAAHDFTNGNCVCGKVKPAEVHNHIWSQSWENNETHHWHECTASGCNIADNTQKDGYAAHGFENGDCVCGKPRPVFSYRLNNDGNSYSVSAYDKEYMPEEIVIPSQYNGKRVTIISDKAFENCVSLTSVTISNGINFIGENAFKDFSNITSVTIPDSVVSIFSAFIGCSGITGIYYTGDIASWCHISGLINLATDKVYINNIKLQEMTAIEIPDGVTLIAKDAFRACVFLESVTIPDSVTSINDFAFWACPNLKDVEIGNGVKRIGWGAFCYCTSLTSITIPENVTSINSNAFGYCNQLESITFNGTKEQWNNIDKETGWDKNTGGYTIHCTDGDIAKN